MSEEVEVEETGPDRRSLMKAAAAVAVPVVGVGGIVAACSSNGSKSAGSSGGAGGASGNGTLVVPVASVPVGGGFVNADSNVVVTQPQAGTYKAFSAVCTHQGCTVKDVSDNKIHCPCHGSVFSAVDGTVLAGPASSPLTAMAVKLNGANVDVTKSS